MSISNILLGSYIEIIGKILRAMFSEIYGINLSIESKKPIDERIAKIDSAKRNLMEAIKAIDELQMVAQKNKQESTEIMRQLHKLTKHKANLEKQIKATKKLADSDLESFRQIVGILSPTQIRRERIIGFISGVIASVVASGLVWLGIKLFHWLFPALTHTA